MLEYVPHSLPRRHSRTRRSGSTERKSDRPVRAKVKPECVHLYPGVNPNAWYPVVQEGEYRDDMEGLWIQVSEWVTYVLVKHFDLDSRPSLH